MEIWKHKLKITDAQTLFMPQGARQLKIAEQDGELCMWSLVDTAERHESVHVIIVGTGQEFDDVNLHYVGTAQVGQFVWHVFTSIAAPSVENF